MKAFRLILSLVVLAALSGCVGKADARLRESIGAAAPAWRLYDQLTVPDPGLDDEDKAALEGLRAELDRFFEKAAEVK